ncbi:expressed unknown protein [Seminavis robusta]|uniref:Uncharacterized protein n=1 Tax=Seminavis robusta TaxID=568900 RepID=A0A9N8HHJ8_9STRA|nr:expressed unknown protein [Seminavis robusta]|eukprot:Sro712_g191370.1 n/a (457) ;mRNA; f:31443-32813
MKSVHRRKRQRTDEEKWPFMADTGHFVHPSAIKENDGVLTGETSAGVILRKEEALVRVPQWAFSDAGGFGANILTCPTGKLNQAMDTYAEVLLALYLPHRCLADLKKSVPQTNFAFAERLREVYEYDVLRKANNEELVVFSERNLSFIQNIQDTAFNNPRYKVKEDDLQRVTKPYRPENWEENMYENESDDEHEHEEDDLIQKVYEDWIRDLESQGTTDSNRDFLASTFDGLSFTAIRHNGSDNAGYNVQLPIPENSLDEDEFVTISVDFHTTGTTKRSTVEPPTPRYHKIIEVLLNKRECIQRANVFKYNPQVEVSQANGSVRSISDWATAANLDDKQRRAFECIIAAFLLTFYEEAEKADLEDGVPDMGLKAKVRLSRKNLLILKGSRGTQLILLLHGPGGSGKTTVIDLVMAYGKEFCSLIDHPFNDRTIVVTAMSGLLLQYYMGKQRIQLWD